MLIFLIYVIGIGISFTVISAMYQKEKLSIKPKEILALAIFWPVVIPAILTAVLLDSVMTRK